jgi:nucleoid-associated protein EbfC
VGFGGMGGGMGRMLMKQMEEMQRKMERTRAELAEERLERAAGGGAVAATASGLGELISVRISPDVVDPADVEMLQDLVTAAVREATGAGRALMEERMGALTGGLKIPGLT